jgi:hypothetical protein
MLSKSSVHNILEAAGHLALGGLVKVDGYVPQEVAGDEVANVLSSVFFAQSAATLY